MTTSPTNQEYMNASEAAYLGSAIAGLTPLLDASGNPVISQASQLSDGFYAEALVDQYGNVIIAYEGTVPGGSVYDRNALLADSEILAQITPQALLDASAFALQVQKVAQTVYGTSVPIYVTGHSLGGAEAQYAALATGFGGVTFGAPGIPGYSSNGLNIHSNLTDYVAYGDPVANFASDAPDEVGFAPSTDMQHVGTVQVIGSPSSGTYLEIESTLYGLTKSKLFVVLGLARNLENHSLSSYASILSLNLPSSAIALSAADEILAELYAQLGTSGQTALSQANVVNANTIISSDFSVIVSPTGTTATITQNGSLYTSSGAFFGDPGTDTITIDPNTDYVTSDQFTDSSTGEIEQYVPDPSTNDDGQTINFSSTDDTAIIVNPTSFTGVISNFQPGDTIDLMGIAATGVTLAASNVLTVPETGGEEINLSVTAALGGQLFSTVSDGDGGTDIIAGDVKGNYAFSNLIIPPALVGASYYSGAVTPAGITDDGEVFGYYAGGTQQVEADGYNLLLDTGFTEQDGVYTEINGPTPSTSFPYLVIATGPDSINSIGTIFGSLSAYEEPNLNEVVFDFTVVDGTFILGNLDTKEKPVGDQNLIFYGTASTAINKDGVTAGYFVDSSGAYEGFIDIAGTIITVNAPNAGTAAGEGTVLTGINNNDDVVGYYFSSNGIRQGFVATPLGQLGLVSDDVAPVANQIEQLTAALVDFGQGTQGTLENLTISGPGTVGLTGSAAIPNVTISSGGIFLLQSGTLNTDPIVIDFDGDISGSGTITGAEANYGTIAADGGALDLTGDITGMGTLMIGAGAALQLEGTVAATESLSFSGSNAALIIGPASSVLPAIMGFDTGDFIEIEGLSVTAAAYSTVTDELTLTVSNGTAFTLSLSGSYQPSDFVVSDGEVVDHALCFLEGTCIRTPGGETPIEQLKIGDLVMTGAGDAKPIKWIGIRTYDGRFIAGNHLALPVCIKQNAIAGRVPARELDLSPGHGVFFDGVLVPAWRLVNGVSITQAESVPSVRYINVELESHEVILANNCPAETFLNIGNFREQFQNADQFKKLYADDDGEQRASIPRLEEGFKLHAIQSYLAGRAGVAMPTEGPGDMVHGFVDEAGPARVRGWVQCVDKPEAPVSVDIWVGGRLVARSLANGYRADLRKAGLGSGCHGFDIPLPAGLSGPVRVRRAVDQTEIVLTDAAEQRAA